MQWVGFMFSCMLTGWLLLTFKSTTPPFGYPSTEANFKIKNCESTVALSGRGEKTQKNIVSPRSIRSQQGMALLWVVWLLVALTAVIGVFVSHAKVEQLQAHTLMRSAQSQQLAQAGLEYALMRVSSNQVNNHWRPDGQEYQWEFDGVPINIRVQDEFSKVDINLADAVVIAGLLKAVGIPPENADVLTQAIIDWRDPDDIQGTSGNNETASYQAAGLVYSPKNAPFESISELQQVQGVSTAIYQQIQPFITIYGQALPNAEFAARPVLIALGVDPLHAISASSAFTNSTVQPSSGTYSINVTLHNQNSINKEAYPVLHAIIKMQVVKQQRYRILRWQTGVNNL